MYLLVGEDEEPTALLKDLTNVSVMKRSPTGDETLVLAEIDGESVITRLHDDKAVSDQEIDVPGTPLDFAWSPDGRGLAISGQHEDGLYFISILSDGSALQSLLSDSASIPTLGGWSTKLDWFAYALGGDVETRGVYTSGVA